MNNLSQLGLTILGLLFCLGDVAALASLLSWQELAPSHDERSRRLWRGVLPAGVVLLALLLLVLVRVMLLWRPEA